MKALVLLLVLSTAALADEPGVQTRVVQRRGWLTGMGLALAGGGVVSMSLGAFEAVQGDAAARTIAAYYANGAAPTAGEAPRVRWLKERSDSASSQALAMLISGGAALVLGVGMVLLDGWVGASVTVAVQPSGASVLVIGRF